MSAPYEEKLIWVTTITVITCDGEMVPLPYADLDAALFGLDIPYHPPIHSPTTVLYGLRDVQQQREVIKPSDKRIQDYISKLEKYLTNPSLDKNLKKIYEERLKLLENSAAIEITSEYVYYGPRTLLTSSVL